MHHTVNATKCASAILLFWARDSAGHLRGVLNEMQATFHVDPYLTITQPAIPQATHVCEQFKFTTEKWHPHHVISKGTKGIINCVTNTLLAECRTIEE